MMTAVLSPKAQAILVAVVMLLSGEKFSEAEINGKLHHPVHVTKKAVRS